MEAVLERMRLLLAEPLAVLAQRVEGRHVKLFTRAHLSALPLHAVDTGQGPLLAHCDVSYGQSLGLLTAPRDETPKPSGLTILHSAARTVFLKGAVDACERRLGARVLRDPTADEALSAMATAGAGDLVFACHGLFQPDDPAASELRLGEGLSVARLFESSTLPGCRSVTLAACSSGLARAEVASESVGLPTVFLAAGARSVVGSLWDMNDLPTAILLERTFDVMASGCSPAQALNAAERELGTISRDAVIGWVEARLPEEAERWRPGLSVLPDRPFAAPVHWAGFVAMGDF